MVSPKWQRPRHQIGGLVPTWQITQVIANGVGLGSHEFSRQRLLNSIRTPDDPSITTTKTANHGRACGPADGV